MSLLDIRHSSRGSTRGGKRLRSFDLAEDNALSTRGDHSTAVLAAAEEGRSSILMAVLAADIAQITLSLLPLIRDRR